MSGHTGAVVQLKFSPDGDTIYTASTDKTVLIFHICKVYLKYCILFKLF